AAVGGPSPAAWRIHDILYGWFWMRRHAAHWVAALDAAAVAAKAAGDARMRLYASHFRGIMHWAFGAYESALDAFRDVLDGAREHAMPDMTHRAYGNMAGILRERG